MLTTDRKANADQHGKNSEEIAPVGKAIWHRPAVRRLETAMETHGGGGAPNDSQSPDVSGA